MAEQAWPEYFGPGATLWVQRLESEHDNLRTAVEWSRAEEHGAEAGLRLAGNLWWFLVRHGHWSEAREWLEGALGRRVEAPPVVLPRALHGASNLAWRRGDYELATKLAADGLAVCDELGEENESALLFFQLGIASLRQGDAEQATATYTRCLDISREMGNKWVSGHALMGLGNVAHWLRGDPERGIALYTQALADFREAGDRWGVAVALQSVGAAAHDLRDDSRAVACLTESIGLCRDVNDRFQAAAGLEILARIASSSDRYERAARLFGAAEILREGVEWSRAPAQQALHTQHVSSARAMLGESAFATAWAEGRAMTPEQAIEYALAETG